MRALNSAAQALKARAISGEKIPLVPLVYVGFPSAPQRWALGGTSVVWGGFTWSAQDLALSPIEDDEKQPSGIRITLPGVAESQISLAVDEDIEGSQCLIYLALLDPATAVAEDAVQVWAGELDMPGWQDGTEALVHLTAEHRATIAMRPRVTRYTADEQQRLFSGDTSLDFDPATDAAPVVWPAASYFKVQE